MNPMQRRLASSMCLVLVTGCRSASPGLDVAAERDAVRAVIDRGTRALVQHDWNAYTTFWANDPDISVVHPAGREWVNGWDAVSAKYSAVIADTSTQINAINLKQDIHMSPSGDMAYVTQQDSLHFTTRGQTVSLLQWSPAVFQKRTGQWRLVHAHASQVAPQP